MSPRVNFLIFIYRNKKAEYFLMGTISEDLSDQISKREVALLNTIGY